jgi:hypothetical protein
VPAPSSSSVTPSREATRSTPSSTFLRHEGLIGDSHLMPRNHPAVAYGSTSLALRPLFGLDIGPLDPQHGPPPPVPHSPCVPPWIAIGELPPTRFHPKQDPRRSLVLFDIFPHRLPPPARRKPAIAAASSHGALLLCFQFGPAGFGLMVNSSPC